MNATKLLRYCRVANTFISFIGLALSLYAVYIELKLETDKDYVAFCDINEILACSKVFSTKYAKGFGLVGPLLGDKSILNQPNGLYGVIMYSILILLSQLNTSYKAAELQRVLVILSNCMTPYLAYLLYKVIHTVCIVCVATYGVNFMLLCVSFWRIRAINEKARRGGKKPSKRE